jgi:prophage antirepressor-like protein
MENDIRNFYTDEFGGLDIIIIDGEPFFPAKDCATLLGYKDTINAIKRHCKHALKRHLGVRTGVKADGTPAYQTVLKNYIPESDLYRLIIRSKLPSAKRFESWVCDEALPSIREHGTYFTPLTLDQVLDEPVLFEELLHRLDGSRKTPPRGTALLPGGENTEQGDEE